MNIVETQSKLTKWEQLTDEFEHPFKAGERQTFKLFPEHEKFKTLFQITGIYHVTTKHTDFLLDAEVASIVQLETNGVRPTSKDLYEVYKKTRIYWIGIILQESMQKGFTLVLTDMAHPRHLNILKSF